jgi:hypothetical protein
MTEENDHNSMRPRSHLLAIATAALTLSACGTRVNLAGVSAAGGGGVGLDGVSTGSTSTSAPGESTTSLSSGGSSSSPDQSTVTASAGPDSTVTDGGSTYVPTAGSTGSTPLHPKTVTIGAWISDQTLDTVAASMGLSGLQTGNESNQVDAMVKDLNAHGGINGAKVLVVKHITKATSTSSQDQEAQSVCDDFTQDHHVNFAMSIFGANSTLLAKCLAAHGVPFVDDDYEVDSTFMSSVAGDLFLPSDWVLDRMMRTQVDALNGMGYFGSKGKVGILLYDTPSDVRVLNNVVIPRLAALGVKSPDSYALKADGSDYEAESNVVIKFRSDGVTKVFTVGVSPLGFMLNAQQQGYHPKYAVYSTEGPAALLQGTAPKQQLVGTVGFGWSPPYDVDSAHDPGPVSPTETRCLTIMKNAGEDVNGGTVRAFVTWTCDAFWFIQKTVAVSGEISAAGVAKGARLMRGYESPVTWRTDLSTGRFDGANAYRDLGYDTGCSCFRYTSGLKPASN